MLKNLLKFIIILFIIILFLFFLRIPILQAIGSFLIEEDKIEIVDVMFILGSNHYERGKFASELFNQGITKKIVTTGSHISVYLDEEILKKQKTYAEKSKIALIEYGVNEDSIITMPHGSSTFEESNVIFNYCKSNNIKKAMVVSDKFHLRRINFLLRYRMEAQGIELLVIGSHSASYNEKEWWKYERGLLMVNNEYIKLLYYWFQYRQFL